MSEGLSNLPLINLPSENSENPCENTFEGAVLSPITLSSRLRSLHLHPGNSLGLSEALPKEYRLHTFGINASEDIISSFYGSEYQFTPGGQSELESKADDSGVAFSPLNMSTPSSSRRASPVTRVLAFLSTKIRNFFLNGLS